MAQYSFHFRFQGFVLDGSKPHTFRDRRRFPAKVGDLLFLFFGLRTKHVIRMREEVCSNTHSAAICPKVGLVFYSRLLTKKELKQAAKRPRRKSLPIERILTREERDHVAWKDGFRPIGSTAQNPAGAFEKMLQYWKENKTIPWAGDVIHWVPTQSGLLKARVRETDKL